MPSQDVVGLRRFRTKLLHTCISDKRPAGPSGQFEFQMIVTTVSAIPVAMAAAITKPPRTPANTHALVAMCPDRSAKVQAGGFI